MSRRKIRGKVEAEVILTSPYTSVRAMVAIPRYKLVTSEGVLGDAMQASTAQAHVVGIQLSSADEVQPGELAQLAYKGTITNPAWDFTPAVPVFLGEDGEVTQEIPNRPDFYYNVFIGMPGGICSLVLDIRLPIRL